MSQNPRILITASLNRGLSIGEINKKIREISKSDSLQKIKIKLDIDSKILQTLQTFNKNINQINRANVEQSKSTAQATSAIQQETQAINQQNQALEKNEKLKKKVTTYPDGIAKTDTTTGTKYNNTTKTEYTAPDGNVIDKPSPVVQNINYAGMELERQKQLKQIADKNLADEKARYDSFVTQKRREFEIHKDTVRVQKQTVNKNLSDEKARHDSFVTQKRREFEIHKDNENLLSAIDKGRLKSQQEFLKSEESKRKQLVNSAHQEANLMNKQFDQLKQFRKNADSVEAEAHKANLKRNKDKYQDARVTDQKLAHILAERENRTFDKKEIANAKSYEEFWQKSLKERENKEVAQAVRSQKRDEKSAQSYQNYWGKALIDREAKEKRFYDSQSSRVSNNKVSSANIQDDNRSAYLISQYDKVIQKMQQMQSSGKVLTQTDIDGINKRIQRLDAYRNAQTQLEGKIKQLTSISASAEKQVISLSNRFGNRIDKGMLNDLLKQLKEINPASKTAIADADRLRNEISKLGATVSSVRSNSLSLGEAMSTAVSRTLTWTLATTAIFGTKHAIEQMLAVIIEIDTELISLKKVMDADTDFEFMLESATESAREFGRTITGALQAYNSFARMGFDEKQVENLGRAAMLLSTVGEIEDKDSAEFLTSTLLQFNMAVEESSKIVDSWNEVSNNFAVTSLDLAQGISRSGQAADIAKVSFDELNGMITAIQASTRRGGAQIGNSLKTIFTRLRMSEVETALGDIGIAVYDLSGDFRSATDIFSQLSTQWTSLNSVSKSYIAEQIAGKFHINNFMALMNSYQMSLDATTSSTDSAGSATRELATFQESLRFQINNLVASFQNLSLAVGNGGLTDAFVFVLKTLTALSDGFASLTESTNGWNIKLPLYAAGVYGLVKAFGALRLAIIGAKMSLGVIGLALVAIETVASLFMNATKQTEINTQAFIDNASEIKANSDNLQGLIDKHNQLKPLTENNTEKQAELQGVLQQINDIAPHLINNTKEYGNALSLNEEAAKTYIATLKEMNKEQLTQAQLANDIQLNKAQSELEELEGKLSKFGNTTKDTFDKISQYQIQFDAKTPEKALENYRAMIQDIEDEQTKLFNQGESEKAYALGSSINELRIQFLDYIDLVEEGTKTLEDYSGVVTDRNTSQQQVKTLQAQKKAIEDQIAGRVELNAALQKSDGYVDEETGAWISNTDSKLVSAQAQEQLDKGLEDTISSLSTLSSAYDTLSQGEQLSADNLIELIDKYPELASYLAQTNDLTFDKGELLKKVAEVDRQTRIEEFQRSLDAVEVTRNELTAKQDLYKQFYQKVLDSGAPMDAWMIGGGSALTKEQQATLDAANAQADNLKAKITALSQPLSFYSGSSSKKDKKPKTNKNKDEAKLQDSTQASINLINKQSLAQEEANAELERKADVYESEKDYQNAILYTNKLLNGQTQEIKDLNSANSQLASKRNSLDKSTSYDLSSFVDANGEANEKYFAEFNGLKSGSAQDALQKMFDQYSQYKKAELENKKKIDALGIERNNTAKRLEDDRLANTQVYLDKRNKAFENYDAQLEKSQQRQSLYKEGSKGWRKEQDNQLKILTEIKDARHADSESIRKKLKDNEKAKKSEKLTTEQIALLNAQLEANSDAWYDASNAIQDNIQSLNDFRKKLDEDILSAQNEIHDHISSMADEIVDIYKEAYEAEKKGAIQATEDKIKLLDKQLEKYEEVYDARMKLVDDEEASEDYKRNLLKLQDEQIDIQRDLNVATLNDDISNKKRREELEKALAEKTNEINDLKHGHEIDLRKKSLQDDLDTKKKEAEVEKGHLEESKENTEKHYDDLINNDRRFAQIRQEVMSGVFTTVLADFATFKTNIGANSELIGKVLSENITDKISKMETQITTSSTLIKTAFEEIGLKIETTFLKTLNDLIIKLKELQGMRFDNLPVGIFDTPTLTSDGIEGDTIEVTNIPSSGMSDSTFASSESPSSNSSKTNALTEMQENSKAWSTASAERKKELAKANEELGKAEGWTRGADGIWRDKTGKKVYHNGGTVGGSSTPVGEALHSAFNLNKNEELAKLLKKEVVINPANFKPKNFLQDILGSIKMPNFSGFNPAIAGGGSVTNQLIVQVENMYGSQKEIDNLSSKIVTGLHKMGVKI